VRRKNKLLSLIMVFMFAAAFLIPSLSMPATALAEPDVSSGYTDSGNLEVTTEDADNVDGDEATLVASVEVDEDDYDSDLYEITEYGFFYGYDENDVDDVEDLLADEDDSWDCDYEEGDDIDYDDGDEIYEFSLDLSDLDEDEETYYFRAYIEYYDSDEDEYYYSLGDINEFDVDEGSGSDKPEVTTDNATSIDGDSAVLNGTIESYGDDNEITEYGFYYGTTSSPTTKKMVGDDEDEIDEGDDFDYQLSSLKSGTKYYFRAYAKNSEGTAYGSVKSFTTSGSTASASSVFTIGFNYYLMNGKYQLMDAAPYIKNNRTYLPIRYVGYAMGLTDSQIQWQEATQTVILTKGSTTVILVIGSPTMFINGQPRTMDVSPELTSNRTCLPIAWVASAFGYTAAWNGTTQQVTISGATSPSNVDEDIELKLSRTSVTLEPEEDTTITGTLDVDIEDVDYDIDGDSVVSVDIDIDGDTFDATIEVDSDADDGDECTITFTATDEDGNEYEADFDVSVEDSGGDVDVNTISASDVGVDYATLNGEVADDDGLDIDEFGFYYGTDEDEVADGEDGDADYDEADGDEDEFYLELSDLDSDTRYYFMAYAIDEDNDIHYGSVRYFTTDEE